MNIKEKVDYVLKQKQTRFHTCHWPGCVKQAPPAMWGCKYHWYQLPIYIRNEIWEAYKIGQEIDMNPTKKYLIAAQKAQEWIKDCSQI